MKISPHETISATDLVRHLSAVIDKVRVSGQSLYITKGAQTIAELSPPPKIGLPIQNLVSLLKTLPKLEDDATMMSNDLKSIKNIAQIPSSPWE